MTEHEFHAARRMFVVNKGTVLVAPAGLPVTHVEWLADVLGSDEARAWVRNHPRGYVLGDRLVIYRGEDFSPMCDAGDLLAALDTFDRMMPGVIKVVGRGAVPGPGQPWEPKHLHDAAKVYADLAARAGKPAAPKPTEVSGPYIVTAAGRRVSLSRDRGDLPTLPDVALNHARTPMFAGYTDLWYAVGHHCLAAQVLAGMAGESPRVQLYTLLHEAEVAVFGDVPGPVKCQAQRDVERWAREAFYRSIELDAPSAAEWERVETYDKLEQAASAMFVGLPEAVHAHAWSGTTAASRDAAHKVVRDVYADYPPAACLEKDSPMARDFAALAARLLRVVIG